MESPIGSSTQQRTLNPDLMTQEKAESKHTPGPWTSGTENASYDTFDGIPITEDATGYDIGTAWGVGIGDVALTTQQANARLIAAAPDLLAALVACLQDCDSKEPIHPRSRHTLSMATQQMAWAAIAKATTP